MRRFQSLSQRTPSSNRRTQSNSSASVTSVFPPCPLCRKIGSVGCGRAVIRDLILSPSRKATNEEISILVTENTEFEPEDTEQFICLRDLCVSSLSSVSKDWIRRLRQSRDTRFDP